MKQSIMSKRDDRRRKASKTGSWKKHELAMGNYFNWQQAARSLEQCVQAMKVNTIAKESIILFGNQHFQISEHTANMLNYRWTKEEQETFRRAKREEVFLRPAPRVVGTRSLCFSFLLRSARVFFSVVKL